MVGGTIPFVYRPLPKRPGLSKVRPTKADEYYKKVTDKVAGLIVDTVQKWDVAGL